MPIEAARWQVAALWVSVEIISACDHFAQTMSVASWPKRKSGVGNIMSWTTAVLPDPPCPINRIKEKQRKDFAGPYIVGFWGLCISRVEFTDFNLCFLVPLNLFCDF